MRTELEITAMQTWLMATAKRDPNFDYQAVSESFEESTVVQSAVTVGAISMIDWMLGEMDHPEGFAQFLEFAKKRIKGEE